MVRKLTCVEQYNHGLNVGRKKKTFLHSEKETETQKRKEKKYYYSR